MAQPIAYYDPDRQLARVVNLDDVRHHPNGDRMDLAIIEGWQVIVGRDTWKKGDKVLFCEVGGVLPLTVPEFIEASRGGNVKTLEGNAFALIKTIKLRKELSQGFVCPVPGKFKDSPAGTDLTKELGVLKYVPNPTQEQQQLGADLGNRHDRSLIQRVINFIAGEPVSNLLAFPEGDLTRSTESRAQNMVGRLSNVSEEDDGAELSVKLDGNSMSVLLKRKTATEGSPEVITSQLMSRDTEISLKPIHVGFVKATRLWIGGVLNNFRRRFNGAEKVYWPKFQTVIPVADNHFTQMHKLLMANGLKDRVQKYWDKDPASSIAFQGEVIGPNVMAGDRNNYEGVKELQFRVYRVFIEGEELKPAAAREICKFMHLQTVPILDTDFKIRSLYIRDETSGREYLDIRKLLAMAEGPRSLASGGQREGIVIKSNKTGLACKVISDAFLIKNGDA